MIKKSSANNQLNHMSLFSQETIMNNSRKLKRKRSDTENITNLDCNKSLKA